MNEHYDTDRACWLRDNRSFRSCMAALIINAHNIGVVLHGTHDELFAWRMMTYNIFVVPEAMMYDGRFPKVTKPITNQL